MFDGLGQLDRIYVTKDFSQPWYSLFERIGDRFEAIPLKKGAIPEHVLNVLSEGRLYAKAIDLRYINPELRTMGRFTLDDLELFEIERLSLSEIRTGIVKYSKTNSGYEELAVTGYKLGYNLYSADGKLAVRKGKMRVVEGKSLLEQLRKGRKFYAKRKDAPES